MEDLSKLPSDQMVNMTDVVGNVVPMKASDAAKELNNPLSNYNLSTPEQIQHENTKQTYGGVGQEALSAAEGALDTASLGMSKPLIKGVIGATLGPEAASQYQQEAEQREAENPFSSTIGKVTGVVTDPFGIFGTISKVGGIAEKVAAPIVENTLGKGIVGTASKLGTKYATEGALIGAGSELSRQSLDDLPYSGEAMLDAAKQGAILMGIGGPAIHSALEATTFMLGKTKNFAKDYLDKVVGASEQESGQLITQTERDALKRTPPTDVNNPGIKSGLQFENQDDGSLIHTNGNKKTKLDSIQGNGLNLFSPEDLYKAGNDLGIRDLDLKNKLKLPIETYPDFFTNMKVNEDASSWIKSNYDSLTPEEKAEFLNAEKVKSLFRNIENPNPEQLADFTKAIHDTDAIAAGIGFDSSSAEASAKKTVSDYFNKLDYINDGKLTHVYNTGILPEYLTTIKEFNPAEAISQEAKGVAQQFKIASKKIGRLGPEDFNEVAKTILDHYPNQMTKLGDVSTSFDYISNGIKRSFDKAGEDLQSIVQKTYNRSMDSGIKPTVTNSDIANFLEDNVLKQYTDKLTGNPLPNESTQYDAIKKLANEYRDSKYVLNKYQQRVYEPYDIQSLYNERVRVDKKVNWDTPGATAINNANKNIRFFLDDHLVDTVKSFDPKLAKDYLDAKQNWRILKSANDIVGAAAEKALTKASSRGFKLQDAIIGGVLKGPAGAAAMIAKDAARDFLTNNSGNIQAYFARNMNEGLGRYIAKVDGATNGFFKNTESVFSPMLRYNILKSNDVIKNDQKRLESELANREDFANKFISTNNSMFDLAPNSSKEMLQTAFNARDFLASKIPQNPYKGMPYRESQWAPNPQDVSKYLRYREAVEKPSVILNQIKDGYVTPEAIEVLNAVYPQTREFLKQKMLEKISSQKEIPQEKRVMLFKTFGIPLDSLSQGPLFAQMQMDSMQSVQNTLAQNTPQNVPLSNATKIKPMDSTLGNQTLREPRR